MRNIVNALLVRQGSVLLARRGLHRAAYPGLWSFPGGHVEPGETPEQALLREAREEIGILPLAHRAFARIADPTAAATYDVFLVRQWRGDPVIADDEHSELRWFSFEEAAALPDLALDDYRGLFDALRRAAAEAVDDLAHGLRQSPSATRLLLSWCADRGIGEGPIRADRRDTAPPEMDAAGTLLETAGPHDIRHRRVTLRRGAVALSDCDIWWVPSRLAPSMQATLEATDRPFGLVVESLNPVRRMLSETILPPGGLHVLEQRAMLLAGDGVPRPIALVRELYRRVLID